VLAYSGGLDTSVAIKWIEEKYDLDVVTLTLDLGQGGLESAEEKARAIGAVKHYSTDAREEFVREYVSRAIKANALYQGKYPLSAALSRPLIATKLVEIAHKEGAVAVAHGCTGKGNDQVRFEVTIRALDPSLKILAPIREWNLSRDEEVKYARARGIPVSGGPRSPYSIDQNLWGRSIESGAIEDADNEPPADAFVWTVDPVKAPDSPEYLAIEFADGLPAALNGEKLPPIELLRRLNHIAGKHGVGRIDHVEDRLVGIKSREVYECPAATFLIEAHKDLEKAVLTRHELRFKQSVDDHWANLAYEGLWLDPLREELDAFVDKTQERVHGTVNVKLYKGGLHVVGRTSPFSLYELGLATYEGRTDFNQKWAEGFIEVWGLPTKLARIKKRMRGA